MAQGTLSQGYPTVYAHDGSEHEAAPYIDHEYNTESKYLEHLGPESLANFDLEAGENIPKSSAKIQRDRKGDKMKSYRKENSDRYSE